MGQAFAKFDLTGRTALVTGGSAGMGYYMARSLARSGATVVIAARREKVLKEAVEQLAADAPEGKLEHATVDLLDRASVENLAGSLLERFGGIDILIGNAGADLFEPVDAITDERIDQVMQVNLAANVALTRAFLPHMRAQKWGRILFTSSTTSLRGEPTTGMGIYSASKSAINAFARTAAAEVGHDNITVNTIVLGVYWTDMLRAHLARVREQVGLEAVQAFERSFAGMTAAGRLGNCEEIEGLIQLLASDAGSYITATNLPVDGGMASMLREHAPIPERLLFG